jgi:glycosyltransferase involved in cell wall biosynthesis
LGEARGRAAAEHRVRFLNVSAIQPRKNLLGLLRVWLEATRVDDDAVLIVKLSYSGPAAAKLMRDLHFLEREIGRTREQAASLLLIDPIFSDAEMPGLYAAATHYWSMSRGEGWDQPMTEAAASGLRLIAPDHTAYRTYLDRDVATLLPSRQEPASRLDLEEPDPRVYRSFFTQEPNWWEPDREAAIDAVRQAIDGRDVPRGSARERMKRFSWDNAARRLCDVAEEVVARSGSAA